MTLTKSILTCSLLVVSLAACAQPDPSVSLTAERADGIVIFSDRDCTVTKVFDHASKTTVYVAGGFPFEFA